jgi:hypothetical protein
MTLDGLTTDSTTVLAACACLSDCYLHLWHMGGWVAHGANVRRSGEGNVSIRMVVRRD